MDTRTVVDPSAVAQRLPGVTVTDALVDAVRTALLDVQADVRAYLGAPILPIRTTVTVPDGRSEAAVLSDYVHARDIEYGINNDQRVTVAFTHGYDAATDADMEPVRRYVTYHALNQPGVINAWTTAGGAQSLRRVKSEAADGQSASFEYLSPTGQVLSYADSQRGASKPPELANLDYWRIAGRRVFSREGYESDPASVYDAMAASRAWGGWWW